MSLEFELQCASCLVHCAFVCYVNRALNSAYDNNLDCSIFVCICMCDVDVCMHGFWGGAYVLEGQRLTACVFLEIGFLTSTPSSLIYLDWLANFLYEFS